MKVSLAIGMVVLGVGCGGAQHGSSALGDMDKVRASAAVRDAHALAPQMVGRAEEARKRALEAQAAGDEVAAGLFAEQSVAAYEHAIVLARLGRAKTDQAEATEVLTRALEQAKQLSTSRIALDREVDDLDKQLKVAREAATPASSGPADPQREAARLVAARSLAMQARLLCGAAKIVASGTEGIAEAESQLATLDKQLDQAQPKAGAASIDTAARLRAQCLSALTKARRTTTSANDASTSTDALLAALSAAGSWDPSRDERGVVVTLRGLFKGSALAADAETKLRDLGRVASAHSAWGVQVVVHDAAQPSPAETTANAARAETLVKALVAAGAGSARVKSELAGAKSPLVDPSDARGRGRNARVEIVFVAPK